MFQYQKEFFKKKINEEIAFDLITLFHVQIQAGKLLPQEHLPLLQNLLDFIITKYLKQEVNDDLSVGVDKVAPVASL